MHSQQRSWRTTAPMLFLGLVLMGSYTYFVSRHRILWSDELFGWMLVTDPSAAHMLSAWKAGADGGGLGFYLLGRWWLDLFGRTDLAFRSFSAAGCYIGFAAAWFALRRFYRAETVAVTLLAVWFGSHTILWQLIQTRFYGMLLAGTAMALCASVRSASEERTSKLTLTFTFVANLVLVSAHPLGAAYAGALLGAAAVADWIVKRRRPWFYLAALLPWIIILFSREAMHNTALVGKPYFWTTTPTSDDLIQMYTPDCITWIITAALMLISAIVFDVGRRKAFIEAIAHRRDIFIPGVVLSASPVIMWIASQGKTSLFVDRYLIPFTLGVAVLAAEGLTVMFPNGIDEPKLRMKLIGAAVASFLLFSVGEDCVRDYPPKIVLPPFDFTSQLAAQLPRGIPVVFERIDIFDLMLAHQDATDLPMYYLLDWDSVILPTSPRGAVSGYHEMENWKHMGYYGSHIVPSDDFIRSNPDFIILANDNPLLFNGQFLPKSEWDAWLLGRYRNGSWSQEIWRIKRRAAPLPKATAD